MEDFGLPDLSDPPEMCDTVAMVAFMTRRGGGLSALCLRLFGACVFACCNGAYAVPTGYTTAPFEHYQPILDRMPFGAVPPGFGQAAEAAPSQTEAQVLAEQQQLARKVNMSCINVTPDGQTAIGFTDLEAKPPVNYYLLVGATASGWKVVKADYDEEWAQIEKDGVTITLKLGKGLIEAPPAAAAAKPTTAVAAPVIPVPASPAPADVAAAAPALPPGLIRRASPDGQAVPGLLNSRAETEQIREEIKKLKTEGGDIKSYMERLRERRALEKEEKAVAEQAAHDKLQELARRITQDELKKREDELTLNPPEPADDAEAPAAEEAAPQPPTAPAQ